MAATSANDETGGCGDKRAVDRMFNLVLNWVGYATLAISWALSLAFSGHDGRESLVIAGLVAATASWVFFGYTRLPGGWEDDPPPLRAALYFFGMLALGAALMSRDGMFFVFVITGFFHAVVLRPAPMVAAGIGASSIVVNVGIVGTDPDVGSIAMYMVIVVIQTLAISGGYYAGHLVEQLTAQREEALRLKEAALEENAGLHMQLLTQAREAGALDERQRMAREIHDTVAQGLAGIIAQLHAADGAEGPSRRRHLDSAAELARSSLEEARRTVRAIGPPTLEEAHLPDALAEEADRWSAANGVAVAFTTTGRARPMHPEVEVTLLRTAQEALANVRKHAEAARVGLTLSYMDDEVALDVRDDGRGFDPRRVRSGRGHGYGLTAMRQRVGRLSGRVSIESEPGGGTVVSANVPAIPQAVADAV